jgi:hypothetical protein
VAIDYSDDTPDVAFQYDRLGRMKMALPPLSVSIQHQHLCLTFSLGCKTMLAPPHGRR